MGLLSLRVIRTKTARKQHDDCQYSFSEFHTPSSTTVLPRNIGKESNPGNCPLGKVRPGGTKMPASCVSRLSSANGHSSAARVLVPICPIRKLKPVVITEACMLRFSFQPLLPSNPLFPNSSGLLCPVPVVQFCSALDSSKRPGPYLLLRSRTRGQQ